MKSIIRIAAIAVAAAALSPQNARCDETTDPVFAFAATGTYLPKDQARLAYSSRGVTNITVRLYKTYDNNIPIAGKAAFTNTDYMRKIAERKMVLPPPYDVLQSHMLDLASLGDGALGNGAYKVEIDTDALRPTWWGGYEDLETSTSFMLGDMGIVAFEDGADGRFFFAAVHSLVDGAPVAGAKVSVLTRANQVAGTGATDANGAVRIALDYDFAGDAIKRLVVEKGGEYSFIPLDYSTQEFGSRASDYTIRRPRAYMFAARNIARPGETIEIQALVRSSLKGGYAPLASAPVDWKIVDANNQIVCTRRVTTDETGYADLKFDIPASARTGFWSAELSAGGETAGTYEFSVSAYQPDRAEVSIDEVPDMTGLATDAEIGWKAKYYFGADVKLGRWRTDLMFSKAANPEHWKGWTCDLPDTCGSAVPNVSNGEDFRDCKIAFRSLESAGISGSTPVNVYLTLDVTPEGERTISAARVWTVFPRESYIGIREGAALPGAAAFEFAVLPAIKGKYPEAPVEGEKYRVCLSSLEWREHVIRSGDGRVRCEWGEEETEHPELDRVLEIAPGSDLASWRGALEWKDLGAGKWRISVFSDGELVSSETFWHSKGAPCERPVTTAELDFTCDKPSYLPGDIATISFESPFAGVAHVAYGWIGLEGVFQLEVGRGENKFQLKIPENVKTADYSATVTLVTRDAPKMRRMSGAIKLPLDTSASRLAVKVETADVLTPDSPAQVKIQVKDSAGRPVKSRVQVMATDEGVLALTGFDTPDPHRQFTMASGRPFSVYDLYSAIYPDLKILPNGEFGGGLAKKLSAAASRQREDGTLKERKTVTFTLAPVDTDENGCATLEIPAFGFTGLVRVMAVAWTCDAAGSAAKGIVSREKATGYATAPRFAVPGDEFDITVLAFNNDLPATNWEYTLSWPGGSNTYAGFFAPGDEITAAQRVKIPSGFTGEWKIEGVLKAGSIVSCSSHNVFVRPANPAETEVTYLIAGEDDSAVPPADDEWIDCQETIEDFDTPAATLKGALGWLERYPYGCLEQTCAQAFPFLAADELFELGLIDESVKTGAAHRIECAWAHIQEMSRSDGSFGMWPWSDGRWIEGSVFAWHFIAEAAAEGCLEKDCALPKDLSFLKSVANNTVGAGTSTAAYACYVLAAMESDSFLVPARNILASQEASATARFFAAASLVRGGYRSEGETTMENMLAKGFWRDASEYPAGEFASSASRIGQILFICTRAGIGREHLAPLMGELNRLVRRDSYAWGSTRDNAWAALGLAVAGVAVQAGNPAGCKLRRIERVGVRKEPGPARSTLGVSRRFLDADGVEKTVFKKGELAIVEIDVASPMHVENAVVCALVPAGFEIEDSALKTRSGRSTAASTGGNAITPSGRSDIRDDRWLWYGTYWGDSKRIQRLSFKIRAVTPGIYTIPAASVEDMYDPDVAGDVPGKGVLVVE